MPRPLLFNKFAEVVPILNSEPETVQILEVYIYIY